MGWGDTFECHFCGQPGAYFDGVMYNCPSCKREWQDQSLPDDDD